MLDASLVVPLPRVGGGDLEVAGGKASNLGELIRSGFRVPEGFVVTTRSYRKALGGAGLTPALDGADLTPRSEGSSRAVVDPQRLRAKIEELTIPPPLAEEIRRAYLELGQGPVAVRSSATAEDLPGAAFAGQQETFLNVIGVEAVLDAVRGCWASLWAERAVAYRDRLGYAGTPEIAVVVQRMVPSEFAGVLFTANPVTGVRDEVVIEASPGLGEAVVSGLVTPEHVVIDRQGRIRERRPGRQEVVIRGSASGGVVHERHGHQVPELAAHILVELAEVGREIARYFGRPQDVEWAYAAGIVWVVQARPLTALPPAPLKANRVQREAGAVCAELLPTRPYPLDMTAWTIPGWFAILARMVTEVPAVRIDVRAMFPEVDGVVTQLLPPEPHPTWQTLTTPVRVRERLRRYDPARWTADPRFLAFERRLAELKAADPAAMSWSELMGVPADVFGLLNNFVDVRIDYLPAVAVSVVRLRVWLAILGASSEFWPLLAGQVTQTRAANDALKAIAQDIRHTPAWAEAFATSDEAELTEAVWHAETFRPVRDALQRWLGTYGHRETTSAALISSPTWAEDPELILGSLRGLILHPPDEAEKDHGDAAQQRIRRRRRVRLTGSARKVLQAAAAARAGMAFREDTHFHALRVRPILRNALLEAGRRLARTGVLEDDQDVFHLKLEELRRVADPSRLSPARQSGLRQLVRDRSVKRAEFGEAPLISPATLYPGVARPAANALASGTPGGGGRATGPVRVIREPSEFGELRPGDVLVCPYTNPSWTPLFQLAAAVVADSGSFGSHAAIVAREYGIPAVMGTGNGTTVLHDGLVVVVDGTRGHVVPADVEDGGVRG